jgi:hypothetical protein
VEIESVAYIPSLPRYKCFIWDTYLLFALLMQRMKPRKHLVSVENSDSAAGDYKSRYGGLLFLSRGLSFLRRGLFYRRDMLSI